MKFFVDTADIGGDQIARRQRPARRRDHQPLPCGQDREKIHRLIAEICAVVPGPVSAEVAATDYDGMMREGPVLREIAKNVTVKVPLTPDGLRACRRLTDDGTMVNVTLCFSAAQALLAAKAGATFISPFVGRLDDIGQDGMALIADIMQIFRNYQLQDRGAGRLGAPPDARDRGGQDGRPCRDLAAGRAALAVQPSADRQGPGGVPGRLGKDRPDRSPDADDRLPA